MTTETTTSWPLPDTARPFDAGPGRTEADRETWKAHTAKVHAIAMRNGWTKAETARQIGLPSATFHGWYDGSYKGRFDTTNEKVAAWLEAHDERAALAAAIPASPPFINTVIAGEIVDMLGVAQMMPALVMATAGAGMGKTTVARAYCEMNPHTYLVTVSPHTRTVHSMLVEIADVIGVRQHNPGRLVRSIGEKLRRTGSGSLLIVDEAQNLADDAVNQLRHFVDVYDCGVAILGNTETYSRFSSGLAGGVKYAQLRRRFFKRMRRDIPRKDDLAMFIKAWGITDDDQVRFLTGVGMKPGALGQIDMTVKLAKMVALGKNRDIALADLKAAWENRDVEGLT
ncbi:AAA family ATPase [Hoeflea sp. WL0058]|uniref:AAA family ATPase n=1 Tax=Flavimaribacter sediminis TaxID=2865987 RepID=A0AAE3D2W0_9HYPH|nr:AAA family ATPase [Flavimaribacter sediminis]MBW8638963.1 AAA family ATPase [Flavimaribacter sediminis]